MKQFYACMLYFSFFTLILNAKPKILDSFDEIYKNLRSGEKIRVILDYSKCKLISDSIIEKGPNAIGGMNIENFEYFGKGLLDKQAFISSSQTVLIKHPRYGFVLNYIKLKIFEDNSVSILAQYLNPISYEVKMDETFTTKLSSNIENLDGATFYKIE